MQSYNSIIQDLGIILNIGELEIRSILNLLITIDILKDDDPLSTIETQYFALLIKDTKELLEHTKESARRKIVHLLGDADDHLINAYMKSYKQQ